MKIEYPEKKHISKELLPQIVERIFAICKNDQHFPLKTKMTNIDEQISLIHNQMSKQDKLLSQSKELTSNLVTRMTNLKQSNQEMREQLIEALGSEL